MLRGIKKNKYHMYNKSDIEHIDIPFFADSRGRGERADWGKYASKTRLEREYNIKLTDEQLNNPDAFSRGINGYYPIWEIDRVKSKQKD